MEGFLPVLVVTIDYCIFIDDFVRWHRSALPSANIYGTDVRQIFSVDVCYIEGYAYTPTILTVGVCFKCVYGVCKFKLTAIKFHDGLKQFQYLVFLTYCSSHSVPLCMTIQ